MNDNELVKKLSRELTPRMPLASSQKALFYWVIFTFICLILAVSQHSLRPDFEDLIFYRSFHFELFTAFTASIIAAGSALQSRVPGFKVPVKVLGTMIGLWLVTVILHSVSRDAVHLTFSFPQETACFASIFMFAMMPGILLFTLMKRGASTQPKISLALSAIAVTAAAAAFLPLACSDDGLIHLLSGHVLPVFVAAGLAWVAGDRALNW